MLKNKVMWQDALFIGTIVFFVLSLINIALGLLGFICALTPFYLAYRYREKVWCKKYCPRASLFSKLLKRISFGLKPPEGLYSDKTKRFILNFFCINLVMISYSTLAVADLKAPPMDYVRFLMLFKMPFELPQLIQLSLPATVIHVSYRVFSIMFSSTIVGLILGIIYRPRSWCAICPVNTLTGVMIERNKEKKAVS